MHKAPNGRAATAQKTNAATVATAAAQRQQRGKHFRCKNLFYTAAIVCALMLVIGSIFMHLKQKSHLGRLNAGSSDSGTLPIDLVTAVGVAARRDTDNEKRSTEYWEKDYTFVSVECLQCIAETATGLVPAFCNQGRICGIYRISELYWQDALAALKWPSTQDFESCILNRDCAAQIVRGYVGRYARDCNGDGRIDCRDHIMLHVLGPRGCYNVDLQRIQSLRMDTCLKHYML